MSGRKPKTILTDQCAAMAKAIKTVMPETHHRLCLWHIFQNVAKHLPHVYKNPKFNTDFKKCIYDHETEDAFLLAWNQMLKKHGLEEDRWLGGLFEFNESWALVYGRNTFCADMTTTQRSESINSMLKRFLKRKLTLPEVLLRYEKALASRRAKELKADFDSSQMFPALHFNAPMLKHVAKVYTRKVFEKFQKEFQKLLSYNIENCGVDGTIQKYMVTKIEGGDDRLVTFDASNNEVLCSCKKFEFGGIQCKHVMKLLNYKNINVLPSQYILKRWTKNARDGVVKNNVGNPIQLKAKTSMGFRYSDICRMAVNLATRGAIIEEAHLVAISNLEKAMVEVEASLKKTQVSKSHNSICKTNDRESPTDVPLTLARGNERGRPTNARMKSCLERGRGKKRSKINLDDGSSINIDQPKQRKGRKGKSVLVEGRNNDSLVNLNCPKEVPTQFSQVTTQELDNVHTFQQPYQTGGLEQPSFLPYLGAFPSYFSMPMSSLSIPPLVPIRGTSTTHSELIRRANSLGDHFPPPSIG